MSFRWVSRVLSWIAAALVGGVFGIAGTIGHSLAWGPIPVGLIVGTIACGAILVAVRTLTHERGSALATGLGMLGMVMIISGVGPGGSIVVPDTLSGRIWTYIVAGLILLAVAWPSFSRLPVRTEAEQPRQAPVPPPIPGEPVVERTRSLGDDTAHES